jgi:NADH:ubiquinone oxidoreductase subunit
MLFLKQLFTWWNSQTLNTRLYTWLKGEYVGSDQFGNKYYRARSAIPDSIPERRWVIYNGYAEASSVPPGWHGWMHHRVANPPTEESYTPRDWQKPHVPNPTGSAAAYRPPGSLAGSARPAAGQPDYQAWKPE